MARKAVTRPRSLPTYQYTAIKAGSVEQAKQAWLDRPVPASVPEALAIPPLLPQSDPPTPLELYRAVVYLGPFAQDYLRHVVRMFGRWNRRGANDPPGMPPHIAFVWGQYLLAGAAIEEAREHFWTREATDEQRAWRASFVTLCAAGCGRQGIFQAEDAADDILFCHNCLREAGLMPRRMLPPPPMAEEEIARRRAERAVEEAPRLWRGDDLAWDKRQPIFLTVPHRGDDGILVAKMVGKLDLANVAMIQELYRDRDRIRRKEEPTGAWRDLDTDDAILEPVFYHAHSASQRHRNLDCPAPLDTVVADFLYRSGVYWVFCYEREEERNRGILRFAPIFRFRAAPVAEYDTRWRYYLAEDHWERLSDVAEWKRRDSGSILHVGPDRETILDSPWIPETQRLVLKKGKAS